MLERARAAIHRRLPVVAVPDRESRSILLLQDLLRDYGFLPVSGSALSFESMLVICNDIVFNDRKAIIEFGSGVSTLVIAALIRRQRRACRFVSVEGNAAWQAIVARQLHDAGTANAVELVHAAVGPHPLALDGNSWYDLDPHRGSILSSTYDSVIVDGPEAHSRPIALSRYPALPFLREHLDPERCFVLLDDADRAGEREIRRRWRAEIGIDLRHVVSKSACGFRGGFFNPLP